MKCQNVSFSYNRGKDFLRPGPHDWSNMGAERQVFDDELSETIYFEVFPVCVGGVAESRRTGTGEAGSTGTDSSTGAGFSE